MKCRIIPLFAAVASVPMLFGATPLNAQEAQRWTLEECIAYAFEHNIEVKQAELDVQTKRLTRSDAGWAYAPDISASSSYSFSSGRVLDPTTYEFVEHQSVNGTSTSVGASVTLFNGMRNLHNLERSRLDLRGGAVGRGESPQRHPAQYHGLLSGNSLRRREHPQCRTDGRNPENTGGKDP